MGLLDLKPTQGAVRHIRICLEAAGYTEDDIAEAIHQFLLAHLAADPGNVPGRRRQLADALFGRPGAEGLEVVLDAQANALAFSTKGRRILTPLRLGTSLALSHVTHADHLRTIAAWELMEKSSKDGPVIVWDLSDRSATLTAQAAQGSPDALAELGIASVRSERFPAAFQQTTARWDPGRKQLSRIEYPALPIEEGMDVLEFVESMRKDGRLSLESEEASRRFVMLLASPLVRTQFRGLLGIYWINGPAGSGKDLLAAIADAVWSSVGVEGALATAEIGDPSGTEDRRTLGQHPGVVFVRLKEAGKRGAQAIETLIRYTGSAGLSVRPLYRDEYTVENRFTWIADSVEPIPDRREIARRTVVIRLVELADGVDTVSVVDEFRRHGPRIVASLKAHIEAAGVNGLSVGTHEGRPQGALALARLFGANLDQVVGDPLDELFAAMVEYASESEHDGKGPDLDREKLPSVVAQLPIYSAAHFVEVMQQRVGYRAYFETLRHGRHVGDRVRRETRYEQEVGRGKSDYLRVHVGGKTYGLRFVERRSSAFIIGVVDPATGALMPLPGARRASVAALIKMRSP